MGDELLMTKGGPRPNSGPKTRSDQKATNRTIRMTDTEWSTIRQLATAAGQTISDYIRTKATTK